jgi:hypothetical protein
MATKGNYGRKVMAFFFRDYLPQPQVGYLSIHNFGNGADGLPYSFMVWNSGDNRHYYQEDYHNNEWTSTWCMDYLGDRGVLETADVYPKYAYQFWTSYRTTAFTKGKEIFWGGLQNIGDEFNAPIQIDTLASTAVQAPSSGNQHVKYVNQYSLFNGYNDVIELVYDQSFNSGTSAGWRAWHARGVGIVQINWRSGGNDVGNPYKASVSVVKGKIVNKYPVLT